MKILVLHVINSSRHIKCLVPRSFGFSKQTSRAYNPVRRTFYDVNYIYIYYGRKVVYVSQIGLRL